MEINVATDGLLLLIREMEEGKLPHRRTLLPGRIVAGTWADTPLDGEPEAVRDAAAEAWTRPMVRAYRAEREAEHAAANPPPDMAALRAEALRNAMAYGNAITGGEIAQWAGIEPLSWAQQREEALIVRDGGVLPKTAVLPGLAEDKGVTLASYADDVWANAERYQDILRAAVHLRRRARTVLSDTGLDTPAKLGAAVEALRVEADALAAQLIGA